MTRPVIRVVLVELADVEDAATALARALRDAGVEVVYAGRLGSAEQVARTVEQEDPDALGLGGADLTRTDEVIAALPELRVFGFATSATHPVAPTFSNDSEAVEWVASEGYSRSGGRGSPGACGG